LTNSVFTPFKKDPEPEPIFKPQYPPKSDYPMARVVKPAPPKPVVVDPRLPANYKTMMCKRYEQFGKCTYIGCTYAHGQKELNFGISKLEKINAAANA